jgi:hypothetical protein
MIHGFFAANFGSFAVAFLAAAKRLVLSFAALAASLKTNGDWESQPTHLP